MDWVLPVFGAGGGVLLVTMYKLTQLSKEPDG